MLRFFVIVGLVIAGISGSICLATPTSSKDDVRYAQQALTDAGYAPGPVDGIMGKKTRSALEQYQVKAGLPVTGNLDAATLAALRKGEHQTGGKVTQSDTASPTSSVKESQSQIPQPKSPTDGLENSTASDPARSVSDALSVLSKGDWVRLFLIVLLGFAVLSPGGWFITTALGVGVAFLIHEYLSLLWPLSIMIVLASLYAIPLLAAILWKNLGTALTLLLLFSLPITLVSHYFFETQWLIALVDGVALVVLIPFGINRCLLFFGIIDETHLSPSRSSRTEAVRPNQPNYNASGIPDHFVRCDAPSQSSSSPIQSR